MRYTPEELISCYMLAPHPEGGYFKEVYRSAEIIPQTALPSRFSGDRHFSTSIYFLLAEGDFSAFHRIKSDECWHFYAGGRLNIYAMDAAGTLQTIHLGNEIRNDETFQCTIPAGHWFAAEPAEGTLFSFVGCTVAPGFDFTDFELAGEEVLHKQYPQHAVLIKRLTR